LRQEHLSTAEVITDDLHAIHEGTLDHMQRSWEVLTRLLRIFVDKIRNAFDQRVLKPFVDGQAPPLNLFLLDRLALSFSLQPVFLFLLLLSKRD